MSDEPEPAPSFPLAHRGHDARRRRPTLQPVPSWRRPWQRILDERSDTAGLTLWTLTDAVRLWLDVEAEDRAGLFAQEGAAKLAGWMEEVALSDAELARVLTDLSRVCQSPGGVGAGELAGWCEAAMRWAVLKGLRNVAIEFAELAAMSLPQSSAHAATAGRLNREAADYARASQWFRRASRLARIAGSEPDFAIARLGWGNLEFQRGRMASASAHLLKAERAAKRTGNVGLQAAAHHEMLGIATDERDTVASLSHAQLALHLYPRKHPSIPHLVFDIGRWFSTLNHHSLANYLFAAVLPWFDVHHHRILAYAALARSTAAVRDRYRFERATAVVLDLAERGDPHAARGYYALAEAAAAFEEWERARDFGERALLAARRIGDDALASSAALVVGAIGDRLCPLNDILPSPGGTIEQLAGLALAKLKPLPPPDSSAEGDRFPQYFPLS